MAAATAIAAGVSLFGAMSQADAASDQAAAAENAAAMQYEIARRIQDRADFAYEYWKSDFIPHEKELLAEVMALENVEFSVPAIQLKAQANVLRQTQRARQLHRQASDAHCVGAYADASRTGAIMEANLAAHAVQAALAGAEARYRTMNQMIRREKYELLAMGQRQFMNSSSALQAAGQIHGEQAKAARDQSNRAASSAAYSIERGADTLTKWLTKSNAPPTTNSTGAESSQFVGPPDNAQFYGPPDNAQFYGPPDSAFGNGSNIPDSVIPSAPAVDIPAGETAVASPIDFGGDI